MEPMSHPDDRVPVPWYRQFWPWFIILVPLAAVIAGAYTLYVASDQSPTMVVDDYTKIGLATHRKIARDRRASELDVHASVSLEDGPPRIAVELEMADGEAPPWVRLSFFHPTLSERDRQIELVRRGNAYEADLDALPEGRYYVQIEPPDQTWRLAGMLNSGDRSLRLSPATVGRE